MAAASALSSVVLPAPVPPARRCWPGPPRPTPAARPHRAGTASASGDGPGREPPDGEVRAVDGERRDDDVDPRAVGEAGVDQWARDGRPAARAGATTRSTRCSTVGRSTTTSVRREHAVALDPHRSRAVDHDLGDERGRRASGSSGPEAAGGHDPSTAAAGDRQRVSGSRPHRRRGRCRDRRRGAARPAAGVRRHAQASTARGADASRPASTAGRLAATGHGRAPGRRAPLDVGGGEGPAVLGDQHDARRPHRQVERPPQAEEARAQRRAASGWRRRRATAAGGRARRSSSSAAVDDHRPGVGRQRPPARTSARVGRERPPPPWQQAQARRRPAPRCGRGRRRARPAARQPAGQAGAGGLGEAEGGREVAGEVDQQAPPLADAGEDEGEGGGDHGGAGAALDGPAGDEHGDLPSAPVGARGSGGRHRAGRRGGGGYCSPAVAEPYARGVTPQGTPRSTSRRPRKPGVTRPR